MRLWVWSRNLVNEEAMAQWGEGGLLRQKKRTILGVSRWKKFQQSFIEKLCVTNYLVIYKSHAVKVKGKVIPLQARFGPEGG